MRKTSFLVAIISLAAVLLMPLGSVFATATEESSEWNDYVLYGGLNFSAVLNSEGNVETSWTPYAPDGFNYYKVIRDQENSDPVYPDDGYIQALSDPQASSYTDTSVPVGTSYYRVCSIAKPDRYCSEVVTIQSEGGSEGEGETEGDTEITLSATSSDGKVDLSWEAAGSDFPNGFKIAKSQVNENPTYPVMVGDTYIYLADPSIRTYQDSDVVSGETYYYRVCEYLGGVCGIYSNNISVTVNGETEGTETGEIVSIDLSASCTSTKVKLEWSLQMDSTKSRPSTGETEENTAAPLGFKIVKSQVNENPTYPVMEGDTYIYLDDSSARNYEDTDVVEGETYFYRVCEYLGGECGVYSNNVTVTVGQCGTEANEIGFTDIDNEEYSTAIFYVLSNEIVEGYDDPDSDDPEDREYRPDNPINRAEFLKILIEAKFKDEYEAWDGDLNCFSDISVDDEQWYTKYVCFAKDKGIIDGYPDGSFQPEQTINFVEVAKILVNVYLIEVPQGLGPWYEGYVLALQDGKDVPQTIEELDQAVTRGEMAEFIWRLDTELDDQETAVLL